MRIDAGVEQVTRTILLAFIAEDTEKLKTQMNALVEFPQPNSVTDGVRLAAAVEGASNEKG